MTHGSKIIDFIGLNISNDSDEVSSVTKITIMEEKLHARLVAIAVNVIDTAGVERGGTADDPMNLRTRQKENIPNGGKVC